MSRRKLSMALVMLALIAAACGGSDDATTFDFEEEPSAVAIEIMSGDITVSTNSRSGSQVTATVRGSSDPAVTAEIANGVLSITDTCAADCRVDYNVLVGDAADVSILVGDGSVNVTDLDGSFTITLETGDVTINSLNGALIVGVGSGDILGARLESPNATLITGSGNIDVTFDRPISNLVVESGDGDVTTQLAGGPYAVDATTGDGSTEILVDTDAGSSLQVRIATDKGDVTVYER